MSAQKNAAFLLSFFLLLCLSKESNSVDPCVYNLNGKGIIDLTSISNVDGTPAWKSIIPEKSDGHVYSYNPCHSFTQSTCNDVAACQLFATDEKVTYPLGTQNTVQWKITEGQDLPSLVYTSSPRTLIVDLHCLNSGESTKLEVHGRDQTTGLYTMTLSSKCACWDGCKGSPRPKLHDPLGVGAIVIIVFVALLVIYLVVFMAFNKFKRQATGIDILPHRSFWVSLPAYSFAGVMFVFRKVTGKEAGYASVS